MEKAKVVSGLLAMLAAARANLAKYEGDARAMRAGQVVERHEGVRVSHGRRAGRVRALHRDLR
jgi:hypothetical protein